MSEYYGGELAADAKGATAALVCGILGLACCGFLAPIAWVLGRKALARIDASGNRLGGRTSAFVGMILGVAGTIVWILGSVFVFLYSLPGFFQSY